MDRFDDWQQRLTLYLGSVARTPFAYGQHDCALFCAAAINAMTGVDLAADWRGYTTRAEGIAKLRDAGMDDHVALVAATLEECPPIMTLPGDVALIEDATLGIVQGRGIYVLTNGGLAVVSVLAANRAWHV